MIVCPNYVDLFYNRHVLEGGEKQMSKKLKKFSASGFTLIELLIVIVIIGILAGVLLTVINPARQIAKANQAAMRANVEKACVALEACASSSELVAGCNTAALAGYLVTNGTPASSTYTHTVAGNVVTVLGTLPQFGGGTCGFSCSHDFTANAAAPSTKLNIPAADACLIGAF